MPNFMLFSPDDAKNGGAGHGRIGLLELQTRRPGVAGQHMDMPKVCRGSPESVHSTLRFSPLLCFNPVTFSEAVELG
jgi:hypothetical protein